MADRSRRRVLVITSNSSGRGGGERFQVNLVGGLARIGCEVHVLLGLQPYMDGWAEMHTQAGGKVHRLPLTALAARPLRFVQSTLDTAQHRRIARFCSALQPDGIIVSQQYDEDGLDYLAGALRARVAPVAGILHMPMTLHKDRRPLGRWRGLALKRWYARNAYRLVLTSKGAQQEFESYYAAPRPTHVVRTGIDFTAIRKAGVSSELWPDADMPIVGFVGQFVPQKRLDVLLEGWVLSQRAGFESRLLLVGDGPERSRLEEQLTGVPPDRWHITGWTDHPENFVSRIDLFAMSSDFEGLPLALVEAVGSARPAVITNFNGAIDIAEQAPWVTVVPSPVPRTYGDALTRALSSLPELTQSARAGQFEFQTQHSLQGMARDFLRILGLD